MLNLNGAQRRRGIASALVLALSLASPAPGQAEDGGGLTLEESGVAALGQVADLLGDGQDLNGQGASDLSQHDGDLNQNVDLSRTQVPVNAGEVTQEQMGQALENRTPTSQGATRGQNSSPRSR